MDGSGLYEWFLVPVTWPWGYLEQEKHCPSFEKLLKEMVGDVGFGLVYLYLKGTLSEKSFAII